MSDYNRQKIVTEDSQERQEGEVERDQASVSRIGRGTQKDKGKVLNMTYYNRQSNQVKKKGEDGENKCKQNRQKMVDRK